jgi:hypothetical protein
MTSLTERYLAATLRGIPEKQRPDVERELRSSIADAVEDRVAVGEDRAAAETAVLEELGNPTRLAAGMTGRPLYLIGPELFLVYRHVLLLLLGIVVPVVGVVEAAVEIGGGAGIGAALLAGIGGALSVGVHVAFWVTLAFAIVERVDSATWQSTELKEITAPWKVEHLPELPSSGAVGVGETVGEIVTLGLTIGALLYLRGWSWVTDASGEPIALLDPALWDFWFPALIAVLGLLAAFAVPFVVLALTGSLINPAFAAEVGWSQLADGDGIVMLALAAATVLNNGWEAVDGFRRARRRHHPEMEYAR